MRLLTNLGTSLATLLLSASAVAATPEASETTASSMLTLTVQPSNKDGATWSMSVKNTGDAPVRIVADPRLLVLELTPPPPPESETANAKKKKPSKPVVLRCELPKDTRPANDEERELVLPPKRSWSAHIDPRFYCFGARERALLDAHAPGTVVKPAFGWPSATTKPASKKTKLTPPFVAAPIKTSDPFTAVKVVEGASFTFDEPSTTPETKSPEGTAPTDTKGTANKTEATEGDPLRSAPSLTLSMPSSMDASVGKNLSTTVTLKNTGDRAATTYFRSNMIGFVVEGPHASTTCDVQRSVDAPLREMFTTLKPKGSTSVSMLITAACDPEIFAEAGTYRVYPVLDATQASGQPIGLRTVDEKIVGTKPMLLRVRHPQRPDTTTPTLD